MRRAIRFANRYQSGYYPARCKTIWGFAVLYQTPKLDADELAVLAGIAQVHESLNYAVTQPTRWKGFLRRTALARAIRGSNSIEGLQVTVDDAIAAVDQEEPFAADPTEEAWMATLGYRNALTYVQRLRTDPHFRFETSLLRSLHFMVLWYDLGKNPGSWRPGYIAVRDDDRGEVVYEGPDASLVPDLVDELLAWLIQDDSPPIIRAAMAHLNLAKIHPFSDGNGRMARCLQTLVLTRETLLMEPFSSIEEFLGDRRNTPEYYRVLDEIDDGSWNPGGDARPWIRFVLKAHHIQAATHMRRQAAIAKLWSEIETEISRRSLPPRSDVSLVHAAMGLRLRNSTYRSEAGVTYDVAGRDLKFLVDAGLLEPVGEKRGRTYVASQQLRELADRVRTSLPPIVEDPFTIVRPTTQQQLFGQ